MRIIGGRHRGTRLAELGGDKTRPTADRVRESIFNILAGGRFGTAVPEAIVIDLFAGTGALGLEALSRGASSVAFIENDNDALSVLRANIDRLKRRENCQVIAGNATTLAAWRGQPATLVFADAPYGTGDGLQAITALQRIGALDKTFVGVVETGKAEQLDPALLTESELVCTDERIYGRAKVHFLTRPESV